MVRASVTTTLGQNVASHSETRYHAFASAIPLLALALDAIHVQRHRHAEQARQEGENGVGAVAVERRRPTRWVSRWSGGKQGVRQGIEIFVPDGGQILQSNAAVEGFRSDARGSRR